MRDVLSIGTNTRSVLVVEADEGRLSVTTAQKSILVVRAGDVGPQGSSGPPGPPGPPGAVYEHMQTAPSLEWVVNHNLGVMPDVSVRSAGGVIVDAEIVHVTTNQTRIYFAAPFSGSARFS